MLYTSPGKVAYAFGVLVLLLVISQVIPVSQAKAGDDNWQPFGDIAQWSELDKKMQKDGNALVLIRLNEDQIHAKQFDKIKKKEQIETLDFQGMMFFCDVGHPTSAIKSHRAGKSERAKSFLKRGENLAKNLANVPGAKSGYVLVMDAPTELTNKQAQLLADLPVTYLILDGLGYVTNAQAVILAKSESIVLCMGNLTWVSREQATALSSFAGNCLMLNGVMTLDRNTA